MKLSTIIITILLIAGTGTVLGWAVVAPIGDGTQLDPDGTPNTIDQPLATSLPTLQQLHPIYKRNWQTWTVEKPLTVTPPKPKPTTRPNHGYTFVRVIIHPENPYGVFKYLAGKEQLATIGQTLGKDAKAIKIIDIKPDFAVIEFNKVQIKLELKKPVKTTPIPRYEPPRKPPRRIPSRI